ncbi:hypothetical protein E2C01_080731 [Portunus trituberculatus]|uniref:Uncharacterized protein n=1 Tax=Portunus trituberculatus TaxID=210409 RepID=A0A5B7IW55_PORTR|nr:hypothetical protein [Portunus trituberculatus]
MALNIAGKAMRRATDTATVRRESTSKVIWQHVHFSLHFLFFSFLSAFNFSRVAAPCFSLGGEEEDNKKMREIVCSL